MSVAFHSIPLCKQFIGENDQFHLSSPFHLFFCCCALAVSKTCSTARRRMLCTPCTQNRTNGKVSEEAYSTVQSNQVSITYTLGGRNNRNTVQHTVQKYVPTATASSGAAQVPAKMQNKE